MPLPSYEAMQTKVHVLASEKNRSREMAGGRYMHNKQPLPRDEDRPAGGCLWHTQVD